MSRPMTWGDFVVAVDTILKKNFFVEEIVELEIDFISIANPIINENNSSSIEIEVDSKSIRIRSKNDVSN